MQTHNNPDNAQVWLLDEHRIVRRTLIEYCFKKHFPAYSIAEFADAAAVMKACKMQLKKGDWPLLFITDFNHAGANGIELASYIRDLEKHNSVMGMHIVLFSMVSETILAATAKQADNPVNKIFSKADDMERLIHYLGEILHSPKT